jgi:hypothetical protein
MTTYTLWKIKPGKRVIWQEWCSEVLEKHYQEAINSIIEEDLIQERCILFGEGDDSFLLYKHETAVGKEKKPWNKNRKINHKHFELFHDCLERIPGDPVVGYDLKVIDSHRK